MITLSTCETELHYIFLGAKTGAWLIPLVQFMFGKRILLPCILYNDNQGAIEIATKGRLSQRTRHIQIRYLWVSQLVEAGLLSVIFMGTELLHADILTKEFHPSVWRAKLHLFDGSFSCALLRKLTK